MTTADEMRSKTKRDEGISGKKDERRGKESRRNEIRDEGKLSREPGEE